MQADHKGANNGGDERGRQLPPDGGLDPCGGVTTAWWHKRAQERPFLPAA